MEELFARIASTISLLVEAAAVIIVAYGALESFLKLLWIIVTPSATHGERKSIWRGFGMWLLLGLEFELAADIIGSVISPTWKDIGELGAIAVIRTFLNYFLEKDLEQADRAGEAGAIEKPAVPAASRARPESARSIGGPIRLSSDAPQDCGNASGHSKAASLTPSCICTIMYIHGYARRGVSDPR